MSVIDRIRAWFSSDDQYSVDTEYLRYDRDFKYTHISIPPHGPARCNICGERFAVSKMPKMICHVADHDGQGAAEIDPIQRSPIMYSVNRSVKKMEDEEVEKQAENT